MYNLLNRGRVWATRIGRTSIYTSYIFNTTIYANNPNKTYGDHIQYSISLMSTTLTAFPEPITSGLGVLMGVVNSIPGTASFYNTAYLLNNKYPMNPYHNTYY